MNDIAIRRIEKDRFYEALSFGWDVFQAYEAPDYTQEGVDEFYRSIHDEKYLSMLTMFGAFLNEQLVGIIATRSEGTHIALLFVDGKHHRQGIGKKLLQRILECSDTKKLTVNSSPYAVPIYHKLGFVDTGREQTVSGLRFTPMIYDVI